MDKMILRLNDVLSLTGYKSRTTIWRKLREGKFPAPLDLGGHQIGWLYEDVTNWINNRPKRTYTDFAGQANDKK
ncbi:hypothetical protein GCM10011332_31260 [Terasakiella brassicae]|uniref:AlpA family transcriptional regulator n=1 Tax=Terasakiella brassicae TaxID=1634917 RepID=A0A917C6S6_9PROT|nr:AlpA family phage regulatory protein [Terasakiella brassicae]GGF74962.1 hypothetical protein GCM10011332_31260 [Terasakiella brassicae]